MQEVSLYIPCFNAAETIHLCLEAVFKQKYPLKGVLVVDDGSTDETVDIAAKYPVKIIRHKKNHGLAIARNTAIKNIKTGFIASLDADCLPDSDWLKNLMKRFSSAKIVGIGGKLLETYASSVFDLWRSVHMKQYWEDKNIMPPFLFGSNTIFRKKALMNIGLYNENYKNNYEDVDICARFKKAGYTLIYEPKAIVHHLKNDNICSILDTYWRWNLGYYQKKRYYSNQKRFTFKIKDNLGLANHFIEEDITHKRYHLLYLDFLLALHHSLRDFEYFIRQGNQKKLDTKRSLNLSCWLALLDLAFFYHLDSSKDNLSTLVPQKDSFFQNFSALNLILGKFIQGKFRNKNFQKILFKNLYLSVCKIDDTYLSDKLLNLIKLHQGGWNSLLKKEHPHINPLFLVDLSSNFEKWLEDLIYRFPEIIRMIEFSAEQTNSFSLLKGGYSNENR